MQTSIISKRTRALNSQPKINGECVIYWMSRDQRMQDNFALLAAQEYALEAEVPLLVVFNLFTQPTIRLMQHYEFMVAGLKEVEKGLAAKNIYLLLKTGDAIENIKDVVKEYHACAVYCDFSPLREAVAARMQLAQTLEIPVFEVDTNNVVPLWLASEKEEYAARTIRPKIHVLLEEFLVEPPSLKKQLYSFHKKVVNDWNGALAKIKADSPESYKLTFIPGEKAAHAILQQFIQNRLENYNENRNHPDRAGQSELSPYFHYGQLSTLRANLEVQKAALGGIKALRESAASFLEESIIRRELAQNFCYYNKNYKTLEGAKPWAQATLKKHEKDPREIIYMLVELEHAKTHDPAWNAAQIQLTTTGKMHGYMRMYWAKKILEWSPNASTAILHANHLNDKYELDGYEPNGYVGVLWSIAGVHDRPWFERPIYGQIRYMNYNGLKRKFDVEGYIRKYIKGV